MRLFRRRSSRDALVCRQAVELMTDYLDGALSLRHRERLESHLAACPHCAEYLEQLRVTIALSGRVEIGALDTDVQQSLSSVYRQWRRP